MNTIQKLPRILNWTLADVYPSAWNQEQPGDPCCVCACGLIQPSGERPAEVDVMVRFHHSSATGDITREREIRIDTLRADELVVSRAREIEVPGCRDAELTWPALAGGLLILLERLDNGLIRLSVELENRTPWHGSSPENPAALALLSPHILARVKGGAFLAPADRTRKTPEPPRATRPVGPEPERTAPRVLVAGIGNAFLGDDAFGVEAARTLAARPLPPGVSVVDFGIRGTELAHALQSEWDLVVLLDSARQGGAPGTTYVIETDAAEPCDGLETHGMHPPQVFTLARTLGASLPRVVIVGCEPAVLPDPYDPNASVVGLSEPVRQAVASVAPIVESLVASAVPTLQLQEVS